MNVDREKETTTTEDEDIWGQILRESSNKTNYFETKNVIMLGDPNAGSTSLLSKFQPISDVEKLRGIALSYTFVDVYEDDSSEEPIGRTNFWTLEGETSHNDLLKFALTANNIAQSMIVIALDFSQPWNIVDSLKKWLAILETHIKSITPQNEKRESLKDKVLIKWHQYVEPAQPNSSSILSASQKKKRKQVVTPIEDTSVLPPLSENILISNLGLPILVVCCKSDSVVMLEKDFDYKDELFDYIQQYLRRICLQYGAGLIYTSARKDINCDVALEYIENQLFGFELKSRTQLLEKDQIFIPSGWDSLAKITMDFENQKVCKDAEELYENVREQNQSATIIADDDQIKNNLDQEVPEAPSGSGGSAAGGDVSKQEKPKVVETGSPSPLRSSTGATGSNSPSTAPSAEKAVLTSFFTSLISKDRPNKTGTSSKDLKASLTSPTNSSIRQDAQKQLEKMKNI
ncbi:dynein light intermediate chain [Heterostelium album PN500]|uniref:Dynein light intermediate chain n=1 Tax=Heterostelium pallidum (strain ATCC 26659 / Pp 5 / PN500) TaxID=670386 RepID=D3B0Y6_HETP5|nr:dynein light intermediate chain [Heterostelium album PN500]EFA84960.1 dynein light intermediate chain [Heterostelium album PN500]|eukprot:XP_020437070.1 dynein light intermediate chain [Heterostelium album PN500]